MFPTAEQLAGFYHLLAVSSSPIPIMALGRMEPGRARRPRKTVPSVEEGMTVADATAQHHTGQAQSVPAVIFSCVNSASCSGRAPGNGFV